MEPEQTKDEASQKEAEKRNRLDKIVNGAIIGISALALAAIAGWTGYCIGAVKASREVGSSSVTMGTVAAPRENAAVQGENSAVLESEKYISVSLERGDAEGGSTRLLVYRGLDSSFAEDEVFVFRPNGQSVFYKDSDWYGVHDGLVDEIFFANEGNTSVELIRAKDYEANKPLFDEADRILQEAKERFSHSVGIEVH